VVLRGIGPLHHPQVRAVSRRGASAVSADGIGTATSEPGVKVFVGVPVGRRGPRGVGFPRVRFRCLPMGPMVQTTVPCGVTPMRHDGRTEPGCTRCDGLDLVASPVTRRCLARVALRASRLRRRMSSQLHWRHQPRCAWSSGRATQGLVLLLEQLVPPAPSPQLRRIVLRPAAAVARGGRRQAVLSVGDLQPALQTGLRDPEVPGRSGRSTRSLLRAAAVRHGESPRGTAWARWCAFQRGRCLTGKESAEPGRSRAGVVALPVGG
jgi:hypothetical protein